VSRLDELIAAHYPQGVRFAELRDLGHTVSGLTGKTKADFSDGNARFVSYRNVFANLTVDQGADDFVRLEEGEKQHRLHEGDIVFTGSSENVADVGLSSVVLTEPLEPLYLNSFCFAVRFNQPDLFLPSFSKYLFRSEAIRAAIRRCASGVTRINVSKERFMKVLVPLLPLDAQREISEILDQFAKAEAELKAALDQESIARQTQRSRSRSIVLERDREMSLEGTVPLDDLVIFTNGKPHERVIVPEGSIALLTARFISTSGKLARWVNAEDALSPALRGDIAMVMSDLPKGRALARCFYIDEDGKYSANQRVCLLRVRDERRTSARWLYHFLDRNPQLLAYDNGSDQTHLKKGQILEIRVPAVVPLVEQERAAATLDQLDATVDDLEFSLQAERGARRKQYGYYRDRLLTFEDVAV
jgi:type I restriction enzyme S subunit